MAVSIASVIVVIVIGLIIGITYKIIEYNYIGWTDFTMTYGKNFLINCAPELVSTIIFKDCILNITSTDDELKTYNVTNILNKMVLAYQGNTKPDYKFKLSDPGLTPYTFTLPGISDPETLNGMTSLEPQWDATQNIKLTGYFKLINI